MVSRKRKHSTIDDSQLTATKCPKTVPESLSSLSTPTSSLSCSVTSTGTVYEIKGIRKESKYHYLVDWADDPATGDSFKPDWQPKANVDSAAIEIWEAKQRSRNHSLSISSDRHHRGIAHRRAFHAPSSSRSRNQAGTSPTSSPRIVSEPKRYTQILRSQSELLETSSISDLIVRVSQHSSLDRDLYVAYESSLSTQASARSGSRFAATRSHLDSPSVNCEAHTIQDTAIPDSQTPSGSSNYQSVAGTQTKESVRSANQYHFSRQPRVCKIFQSSVSTDRSSTQFRGTELQRSASAPPSTISDSTQGSLAPRVPSSLARSLSDSYLIFQSPSDDRQLTHIEVPDSTEKRPNLLAGLLKSSQEQVSPSNTQIVTESPPNPAYHTSSGVGVAIAPFGHSGGTDSSAKKSLSQATTTDESSTSQQVVSSQSQGSQNLHVRRACPFANNSRVVSEDSSWLETSHAALHLMASPTQHLRDSRMGSSPLNGGENQASSPSNSNPPPPSRDLLRRLDENKEARLAQIRAEHYRNKSKLHSPSHSPRSPTKHASTPRSPLGPDISALAERGLQRNPRMSNLPNSPQLLHSPTKLQSPSKVTASSGPPSPLVRQSPGLPATSPITNEPRTSKSPSVIPDRLPYQAQEEPSRLLTQPLEIDTAPPPSSRPLFTQSVPHTPITPSKLSLHKEVSVSPEESVLRLCNLSDREHVVPLVMSARIQQHYCTTIRYYTRSIKRFYEEKPCKRETVESINHLLEEVSKVSIHIDLQGSGPANQEELDPKDEAEYAESCSAKFAFLGSLLERARKIALNICIVAKPGPLMRILEIFLGAKDIKWCKPDSKLGSGNKAESGLTVFLISSAGIRKEDYPPWPEPHLIIGFDETFQKGAIEVPDWRLSRIPVVRPIVYASLEHIDLCVPRTLNPIERLQKLVFLLLQTQKRVGSFDDEQPLDIYAEWITVYAHRMAVNAAEDQWPVPPIQPIEDIVHIESDSGLSDARSDISDDYKPEIEYWPNKAKPRITRQMPGKRPFDLDWGDSTELQSKKQKIGQQYQAASQSAGDESLIQAAKLVIEAKQPEPSQLEKELAKKIQMVDELQIWAGKRQDAYEKLRRTYGDLAINHNEAKTALANLAQKYEKLLSDFQTMSSDRSALLKEIADQRVQLTGHSNPDIAAAAQNSSRLQVLEIENAKLIKSLENAKSDSDYTRKLYQDQSTAGLELQRELEPLRKEVEDLRSKQESNIVENRRLRDQDVTKQLRNQLQQAKATTRQRDSLIDKLEKDMADLKRGRAGVQTRGSSVQPRSPRGAGSRGVSPAAGLLGQGSHPMARAGSGLGARFRD